MSSLVPDVMLGEVAMLADIARARGGTVETLAEVEGLPVTGFRLGTPSLDAPALVVIGGVHGIERIGTDVALAFLGSLLARLRWDEVLHATLSRCRVLAIPLLNPVGMSRGTRANGNGVDLMRNAPVRSPAGTPLVGGQRLTRHLPWFMGTSLEIEAAALLAFIERETFASPCTIALDVHSGFGVIDRLWYPYARTRDPIADLPAILALARLLDEAMPNHVYRVEQTAQVYRIRGDLWDYLYDARRARGGGVLLPLTLEMGSWSWVRKNPRQGLSTVGRFNPIAPHRHKRTLRRHLPLLDLLLHATASHARWL